MRIYNIFGRSARTHYRNRATASTACTPNATCCSIYLPFPHKYHGCSPLIAYAQLHLTANGSILPNDRHKDRTFPHPEARSRPLHGDARLDCGTFSQKLPNFFRKAGRNLQKVPHFLFRLSRYTFETIKKSRNSPHKVIAIRIISSKTHHQRNRNQQNSRKTFHI